ncbi:hypothetical protein BMS3Bbin07_01495 [bacterium BMS3Bbin07]|nr:hypothetical protein BMS3Bbin07_01495 [bacterium BMS3Bbin07]
MPYICPSFISTLSCATGFITGPFTVPEKPASPRRGIFSLRSSIRVSRYILPFTSRLKDNPRRKVRAGGDWSLGVLLSAPAFHRTCPLAVMLPVLSFLSKNISDNVSIDTSVFIEPSKILLFSCPFRFRYESPLLNSRVFNRTLLSESDNSTFRFPLMTSLSFRVILSSAFLRFRDLRFIFPSALML